MVWQEQEVHIPAVQESAADILPDRVAVEAAAVFVRLVVPDPVGALVVHGPVVGLAGHTPADLAVRADRADLCHRHRHRRRAGPTEVLALADPVRPEEEAAALVLFWPLF